MLSSSSEPPTSCPCARKKVKHIPPPTRSVSTSGSSASITAILSLTLLPPRITAYGAVDPAVSRCNTSTSRSTRPPA